MTCPRALQPTPTRRLPAHPDTFRPEVVAQRARRAGRVGDGALEGSDALREGLARRRGELLQLREALYVTLRQFDPGLDPKAIGASDEWLRPYGRGVAAQRRHEAATTRTIGCG